MSLYALSSGASQADDHAVARGVAVLTRMKMATPCLPHDFYTAKLQHCSNPKDKRRFNAKISIPTG